MILLRYPKFLRCLTADAGNFDRGHSLASLHPPLAALSSLPTSARTGFSCTPGRAHGPCPTKIFLRSRPPGHAPRPVNLSLRSQCAHWLWQSVFPHLIFISLLSSLRLAVSTVETPRSCMVMPYSTSASSMVPRRWVMTMNWVLPAMRRIYLA